MEDQLYPIGTQDFEKIRNYNMVYVDKTDLIYKMVRRPQYVFLSRPRRFGKSLLLSTIQAYFEGKKELFEGLAISGLEKEWKQYPVFHLQLNGIDANLADSLNAELFRQFSIWERMYGLSKGSPIAGTHFRELIKEAYDKHGKQVVILIDEYDNPLINIIDDKAVHESLKDQLKSVYSALKDMDGCIRFGMITGVSRFTNTTIFSGLNNLNDITFSDEYATICGFSREEITRDLWPGVEKLAQKLKTSSEEALDILKRVYDGYHFSAEMADIYNPFSLLNCLDESKISNYWMQSGVPEFLARKLGRDKISFSRLFSAEATELTLSATDAAFDDPVALFYQTGYLTIKEARMEDYQEVFTLGIPNKEVNEGLFQFLLGKYTFSNSMEGSQSLKEMAKCLDKGDPEGFLSRLQSLLAPIGYHLQGKMTEVDFERTMFVIFHILGFHVHSELATSYGRIDLIVETKEYVYVMEIKLGHSAQEALEQIEKKDYALAWKNDGRKVFKIGISFSSEKRNIEEWKIVES